MIYFELRLKVSLQGTGHTDIIRQAWPSISREEEGGRLCPPGTGKSQGHSDGRLVRNTERALRHAQDQGQEKENRDPVHLLRHPHGKRGAAGRQDRTESTAGACLKRKHAHINVLSQRNYASVIENGQTIRPKQPE